jgi:UTP-glucose-1-phosphate uridylyltransferase
LVLFGDSIVKTHSEKSSSRQIIEAYKKKQTSIIGSILTAEDRVSKV